MNVSGARPCSARLLRLLVSEAILGMVMVKRRSKSRPQVKRKARVRRAYVGCVPNILKFFPAEGH